MTNSVYGVFFIVFFTYFFAFCNQLAAQQVFTSLESLLNYTNEISTNLKSGDIRYSEAKKAKLAAIMGIIDLNGIASLNVTNNTRLPVSLFPAETFGGEPGTYREIQTGIQYTNNFNLNAELKLINISGWKNLKLARINIDAANIDNKISKKTLYENISSIYHNIISLQEQLKSNIVNTKIADTLLQIVDGKYKLGLARQQEVNDAKVNYINTEESAKQIEFLLQQEYIAIKILCDIPESELIAINEDLDYSRTISKPNLVVNNLNSLNSQMKLKSSQSIYRQLQLTTLPYLSAFASNSNQQFSNNFSLFDNSINWINSNYIGLKAVWVLPSANSISQISKSKHDYLLAEQNLEHEILKSNLDFQNLDIDFDKAASQMNTNNLVNDLRIDSYKKNLDNYRQGITALDELLNSYNAMINSGYNYISSVVNVLLSKSKININNQIQ